MITESTNRIKHAERERERRETEHKLKVKLLEKKIEVQEKMLKMLEENRNVFIHFE